MDDVSTIFDRRLHRKRRNRVAHCFGEYDFLKRDAAERVADRLADMNRAFPLALELGCHNGLLRDVLQGRGGIEQLIQTDLSGAMLGLAGGARVLCDEEQLPFADNQFDAVLSVASLQTVNDLVGTLIQIRRILKPDGLFIAILPGARTLQELRASFAAAESLHPRGISPHISPFVEVRDAGALLQRTGFALPVVDSDMLQVTYAHPLQLMRDLRGMGESNSLREQSRLTMPRALITDVCAYYAQHFPAEDGAERVVASMEWITMTAWKPDDSQQKPARRGSGQISLANVLGGDR